MDKWKKERRAVGNEYNGLVCYIINITKLCDEKNNSLGLFIQIHQNGSNILRTFIGKKVACIEEKKRLTI